MEVIIEIPDDLLKELAKTDTFMGFQEMIINALRYWLASDKGGEQ